MGIGSYVVRFFIQNDPIRCKFACAKGKVNLTGKNVDNDSRIICKLDSPPSDFGFGRQICEIRACEICEVL